MRFTSMAFAKSRPSHGFIIEKVCLRTQHRRTLALGRLRHAKGIEQEPPRCPIEFGPIKKANPAQEDCQVFRYDTAEDSHSTFDATSGRRCGVAQNV
jgi:hypothetical protein